MSIPIIFDCDNTMGLPGRGVDDGLVSKFTNDTKG